MNENLLLEAVEVRCCFIIKYRTCFLSIII